MNHESIINYLIALQRAGYSSVAIRKVISELGDLLDAEEIAKLPKIPDYRAI